MNLNDLTTNETALNNSCTQPYFTTVIKSRNTNVDMIRPASSSIGDNPYGISATANSRI